MARVGSIIYQVSKIIKEHNGIGISKLQRRNESGLIGENGHKVSDLIHSYKSLDDIRRNLINLGNFAKKEFGIKDMSEIDSEVIIDWLIHKNIVYRTASDYLSQINKVIKHFNITNEDIKEIRQLLKKTLVKTGELAKSSRAYKGLETIVLSDISQPAFELQRDYGLRVKEATHINLEKQLIGNILHYKQKGGKHSHIQISDTLIKKIKINSKKGIYSVNYKTYTRELKKVIESTGQKYNGTHGLRHTFAQKSLENGLSKKEVSEAMGHFREEITNTYLR